MIIGIHTFFHSEDVMHDTTSVGQGRSFNEDQLYIDYHQGDGYLRSRHTLDETANQNGGNILSQRKLKKEHISDITLCTLDQSSKLTGIWKIVKMVQLTIYTGLLPQYSLRGARNMGPKEEYKSGHVTCKKCCTDRPRTQAVEPVSCGPTCFEECLLTTYKLKPTVPTSELKPIFSCICSIPVL